MNKNDSFSKYHELVSSMATLPSLKALQAFATTATYRSMSQAATALCVSQSAISHQIKLLESQLGCRLLDRSSHPLQLTQAGDSLAQVLHDSFGRIELVCQQLRAPSKQLLRIVAQTSIAVEWLAPRLAEFHASHPDIDTLLHMESSLESLDSQQADLVIGTWPCPQGFVSQAFGTEWWFPVCHPRLFASQTQWCPADIVKTPLVTSEQGSDWQLWCQQQALPPPAATQYQQVTLALLAAKTVSSGYGFALSNSFLAFDAVTRGELVALTQWRYPLPWGQYHCHYRPDHKRRETAAILAFLQQSWQQTRLV